jgi:hypothetical protein
VPPEQGGDEPYVGPVEVLHEPVGCRLTSGGA